MKVAVVYARADRQVLRELEVPEGTTVAAALDQSGLLEEFPEITAAPLTVGIYGRVVPVHAVLVAGDRVEIYRPLRQQPAEARRKRVRKR